MSLDDKMTELADAVRSKTGKTGKLSIHQMVSALTPSGNVYWDGNLPGDYHEFSLIKPIPAHTKISDIIVTSDKPDDPSEIVVFFFKDPVIDKDTTAYAYRMNDRWNFNINKRVDGKDISETELPDDLIEICAGSTINNLKIVVKGADSVSTYTTVFQAYTGLANAIKKSTSTSGKLTIEKMITLLGGTTSTDGRYD